jgi:hypothetical protein
VHCGDCSAGDCSVCDGLRAYLHAHVEVQSSSPGARCWGGMGGPEGREAAAAAGGAAGRSGGHQGVRSKWEGLKPARLPARKAALYENCRGWPDRAAQGCGGLLCTACLRPAQDCSGCLMCIAMLSIVGVACCRAMLEV